MMNLEKILIVGVAAYLVYLATRKPGTGSQGSGSGNTYPDFDPTKGYTPKNPLLDSDKPAEGYGDQTSQLPSIGSPNFKPKNVYCGC